MDVGVIIPTYNEAENIRSIVEGVYTALESDLASLLVVDGGSPDGTASVVRALEAEYPAVQLLDQKQRQGLGAAYKTGFRRIDADIVVQMDADHSHLPNHLPELVAAVEQGADVVVGSRFVAGGSRQDPLHRRIFPFIGSYMYRVLLSYPVRDVTSGFKAYNADILDRLEWDALPDGFHFQAASLTQLIAEQATIEEVPIRFQPRRHGEPKYSVQDLADNLLLLLRLFADKQVFNSPRSK